MRFLAVIAITLVALLSRPSKQRSDLVVQFVTASGVSPPEAAALTAALRATMAELAHARRRDNVATAMATVIALSFAEPIEDRQHAYDTLMLSAAVVAILHDAGAQATSQALARHVVQQLARA